MIKFMYFNGLEKIAGFIITNYFVYFCAIKFGIISSD